MNWTNANSHIYTPPTIDIVSAYSDITGYDPSDPETDQGAYMLDVLNYARKQGISGRKIFAYTQLDQHNSYHLKKALYLFGGVNLGLALPISAQFQIEEGVLHVLSTGNRTGIAKPGSWGGHAVFATEYDEQYITIVTWGITLKMTWNFFYSYCDEAYAIISKDFFTQNIAPNGFDIDALKSDLGLI